MTRIESDLPLRSAVNVEVDPLEIYIIGKSGTIYASTDNLYTADTIIERFNPMSSPALAEMQAMTRLEAIRLSHSHTNPVECNECYLLAEVDRLRIAVARCQLQFQWYADLHAEKGAVDKAKRNQEFADMCAAALRAVRPPMGAPTPARSAMVEKVRELAGKHVGPCTREDASIIITAVLDNLPREVMLAAVRANCDYDAPYSEILDAAISAARRKALGHE